MLAGVSLDLERLADTLAGTDAVSVQGRVRSIVGLAIEADVPGVRLGELVEIEREGHAPLLAEVVGFRDHGATLLPFGHAAGLGADDVVRPTGEVLEVVVGDALLGRVLDGLGRPLDGGPPLQGERVPVHRAPPRALERPRIERPFVTGVRAIDGLLTLGEGQRIGVFAGSGVGKSTLLGQIARQAEADVFVVCLVGERGRELREFLDDALGVEGLARGVVVCATADEPPLVRMKSPLVATAIAEGFRAQGKRVLLLIDSVTRFARAARDVALSAGEAPVRRGYPSSVLAALPELCERAGTSPHASGHAAITALYTVLVEGDDHVEDPVADELRGVLDGHIVLRRELASRGHFPAIDVPQSLSRLMPRIAQRQHASIAQAVRAHIATYEQKRDLVTLGAYAAGSDKRLDAALARIEAIEGYLRQHAQERSSMHDAVERLGKLA
jgi:type III secretion protein N (ATPase)